MKLRQKTYTHNRKRFKLREARSKTMPNYIYHVLTVAGRCIEVPCWGDGESVARMVIDGELSIAEQPEYTGEDERDTLDDIVFG